MIMTVIILFVRLKKSTRLCAPDCLRGLLALTACPSGHSRGQSVQEVAARGHNNQMEHWSSLKRGKSFAEKPSLRSKTGRITLKSKRYTRAYCNLGIAYFHLAEYKRRGSRTENDNRYRPDIARSVHQLSSSKF